MRYFRLYTDEQGESHAEELDMPMASADFAPPAPPLDLSEFHEARRVGVLRAPVGWYGDWHPAPNRQLMFHLAGQVECETGDGRKFIARPGTIVLLEDTTGRGHRSRVVGSEEVVIGVVQLEDRLSTHPNDREAI